MGYKYNIKLLQPKQIVVYTKKQLISKENPFVFCWEGAIHGNSYHSNKKLETIAHLSEGLAKNIEPNIPSEYIVNEVPAYNILICKIPDLSELIEDNIFPLINTLNENQRFEFLHGLTSKLGNKSRFVIFK